MCVPCRNVLDPFLTLVVIPFTQNFTDALWLGRIYRLHRFRSTASPVKGLTADILVSYFSFPCPYLLLCGWLTVEIRWRLRRLRTLAMLHLRGGDQAN
jgi:hypothetical protein